MKFIRIGVIALLGLAVIGNAGLLAGVVVTREPTPKPLTSQRIAKASEPAIVLIQSDYTVSVSIPSLVISDATVKNIENQLLAMYYAGRIGGTSADFQQAAINLVTSNPDAYFTGGPNISDSFGMVVTGSGFFVSEDGYLVTAAHVVSANKSDIRSEVITQTKDAQYVATERQQVRNGFSSQGLSIGDAQIDSLLSFYASWVDRYLTVDKIDARYYLGGGSTVQAGDNLIKTGARATVVSVDPTVGGHDIAILKAEVSGAPTLPIAAGSPHLGDATIKVAYPRAPYLQESVPLDQPVPTVMTEGRVERQNPQQNGAWTAWGTDAQFTHGDSGGPILDAKGNVMGIVSFAGVDSSGNQLPGQGYFVPAQYLADDLAKNSIAVVDDPKNLTNTYYRALAEGDNQRYKTELAMLEDIDARSSYDPYVKDDISHAQSEVLTGNDKTPPDLAAYVLPAAGSSGGVILLVVLVWLGVAVARARRRRPVTASASAETVGPAPEPAASPVMAIDGPATDVVESPQEVLRDSTTIAQSAPPEPHPPGDAPDKAPTDAPTPAD